ncbi:MAG: 16S rRNA (uracil(1498)-N(3))-methyltransferase [Alkaliphilus sp.]|nr:16S rRNA (uracil(1498)-N(3))-methyltransferase [Alkaliphilus sp.]
MHRFFVDKQNIQEENDVIIITDSDDVKHIAKVLRLKEKDEIEICDGNNNEYIGEICYLDKSGIKLKILTKYKTLTESNVEVTLFQGIPKASKMDYIIQKCTEMGIHAIVPVITERTIVQIKDKKTEEKKVERWQKVAEEAAKQSKRGVIPRILEPLSFNELLNSISDYDLMLVPYEKELKSSMRQAFKHKKLIKRIGIIVGPEGGFEENEIEAAKDCGAIPVTLGPRILRTETAGLISLSIVMYELGDLGGV